jgi:hypothetical protein
MNFSIGLGRYAGFRFHPALRLHVPIQPGLEQLAGRHHVIVLAFHAVLAYRVWAPAEPAAFDSRP